MSWPSTALFLRGLVRPPSSRPLRRAAQPASLKGEKAVEHLKASGQYASLNEAITTARNAVRIDSSPAPGSSRGDEAVHPSEIGNRKSEIKTNLLTPGAMEPQATAVNPANGFSATFMPEGLRLRGRQGIGADATMFTSIWRLAGLG